VTLSIQTTPQAEIQIRAIDDWWRMNRPRAPALFAEEPAVALAQIGNAPDIGRLYRQSPVPGVRRLLLTGSRYHVYYLPRPHAIWVLALWHARRGTGPPLRAS
jgi:plasmid stabilization system protein ParE